MRFLPLSFSRGGSSSFRFIFALRFIHVFRYGVSGHKKTSGVSQKVRKEGRRGVGVKVEGQRGKTVRLKEAKGEEEDGTAIAEVCYMGVSIIIPSPSSSLFCARASYNE